MLKNLFNIFNIQKPLFWHCILMTSVWHLIGKQPLHWKGHSRLQSTSQKNVALVEKKLNFKGDVKIISVGQCK